MNRFLSLIVPVAALAACSGEGADSEAVDVVPTSGEPTNVELVGNDGTVIGSVAMSQDANGTTLGLSVDGGLEEGMHGVHLHEAGSCELPDFSSAGGLEGGPGQACNEGPQHPDCSTGSEKRSRIARPRGGGIVPTSARSSALSIPPMRKPFLTGTGGMARITRRLTVR